MKKVLLSVIVILLLLCFSSCSYLQKNKEETTKADIQEKVEYTTLSIEKFSFQIPTYWKEEYSFFTSDKKEYYAENGNSYAYLNVRYPIDDEDPVTYDILFDEEDNKKVAEVLETHYEDCSVTSIEKYATKNEVEGSLYQYSLMVEGLSARGLTFIFPSFQDSRWFYVELIISENVKRTDYITEYFNILDSISCVDGKNEPSTTEEPILTVFNDAEIEKALNEGENISTAIVEFEVLAVKPDSYMGPNIWAGEHLNFISSKEPDGIIVGDIIRVEVYKVESYRGSWFLYYDLDSLSVIKHSYTVTTDVTTNDKETKAEEREYFYSTNDSTNIDKGETGIYAYKGAYDNYIIFDFNEGYFYNFACDSNGNSDWFEGCVKIKITGSLNETISVYHNAPDEPWEDVYYFKYKNNSNKVEEKDSFGYKHTFTPTDIDEALSLRDLMIAKSETDY